MKKTEYYLTFICFIMSICGSALCYLAYSVDPFYILSDLYYILSILLIPVAIVIVIASLIKSIMSEES